MASGSIRSSSNAAFPAAIALEKAGSKSAVFSILSAVNP
jgi:hypothetical protein